MVLIPRLILGVPYADRIGGFQPMTFWCDDVFAASKTLKSKGVEFAKEPQRKRGGRLRSSKMRMETSLCCRAGEITIA